MELWSAMCANNELMILLKRLAARTPIAEANTVQALACKEIKWMS